MPLRRLIVLINFLLIDLPRGVIDLSTVCRLGFSVKISPEERNRVAPLLSSSTEEEEKIKMDFESDGRGKDVVVFFRVGMLSTIFSMRCVIISGAKSLARTISKIRKV